MTNKRSSVLPTLEYEKALLRQGFFLIAGIDEAGRGALAGPVAAAAVILPLKNEALEMTLCGVNDSKQLKAADREQYAEKIRNCAIACSTAFVDATDIDRTGILNATRLAMRRAIEQISVTVEFLLIDYVRLSEIPIPQHSITKGDQLSLSIAAASILAKVARDRWMIESAQYKYPDYGFATHKGYGTARHLEQITRLGPCEIHRKTFAPIAKEWKLF